MQNPKRPDHYYITGGIVQGGFRPGTLCRPLARAIGLEIKRSITGRKRMPPASRKVKGKRSSMISSPKIRAEVSKSAAEVGGPSAFALHDQARRLSDVSPVPFTPSDPVPQNPQGVHLIGVSFGQVRIQERRIFDPICVSCPRTYLARRVFSPDGQRLTFQERWL